MKAEGNHSISYAPFPPVGNLGHQAQVVVSPKPLTAQPLTLRRQAASTPTSLVSEPCVLNQGGDGHRLAAELRSHQLLERYFLLLTEA